MILKLVLSAFVSILVLPGLAFGNEVPRESWTELQFYDDWPEAEPLSYGSMWCPGAELTWVNMLTPDCGLGKRFQIRDVEMFSCLTAMDPDYNIEPRLTGTMWFSINASLDTTYGGPVSGKFLIVPGTECDPADLDEAVAFWQGNWQGKRVQVCDPMCWWIAHFNIVGHGIGGELEGLELRGQETIRTFTRLPAAWEFIPDFPYTGPEGVGNAYIKE